jgi:hypothetical protein
MWSPARIRRKLTSPRKSKPRVSISVDTSTSSESTYSNAWSDDHPTQGSGKEMLMAYIDQCNERTRQETLRINSRLESRCKTLENEVARLQTFQIRLFLAFTTLIVGAVAQSFLREYDSVKAWPLWVWPVGLAYVVPVIIILVVLSSSNKPREVTPDPRNDNLALQGSDEQPTTKATATVGNTCGEVRAHTPPPSTCKPPSPSCPIRRSQTVGVGFDHVPANRLQTCDGLDKSNVVEQKQHTSMSDEKLAGMHFNFLAGSGVSFTPLFDALTPQQQTKFKQFEQEFPAAMQKSEILTEEDLPDQFNFIRFLKSDDFDVTAATKRLLATLEWRKSRNVNRFMNAPPDCFETFSQLRIRVFQGFDEDGRPILWERLGEFLGSSSAFGLLTVDEWVDCHTYEFMQLTSLMRESSIKHKRAIMEHTFVGDMTGIRLWPFLRSVPDLTTMAQNVQPHFPEISGKSGLACLI